MSETEEQWQSYYHHYAHDDLKRNADFNVVHERVAAGGHDKGVWRGGKR